MEVTTHMVLSFQRAGEPEVPEHEGPEYEGPEHEGPKREGPECEGPERKDQVHLKVCGGWEDLRDDIDLRNVTGSKKENGNMIGRRRENRNEMGGRNEEKQGQADRGR